MVFFAGCKINLGLVVTGKRNDGFHDIETVLYPVKLNDIVEVVPSDNFSFSMSGNELNISDRENICIKAYELMLNEYNIPPVSIHLHKIIPSGAGLGGGSSDAVAVMKLINDIYKLEIDDNTLETFAATLGSDCPFFVKNIPVVATGRGTDMNEINLDLSGYYLVLVNPGFKISTAEAYGNILSYNRAGVVTENIIRGVDNWKENLKNDFEKYAFVKYPELAKIKAELYESGAVYASMTGSGSVIYGIFKDNPEIDNFQNYQIITLKA